jgi:hypothetical protein
MWADLQTMQMTYQEIIEGASEWNALGDFMNYWFGYEVDRREDLVREPIKEPQDATPELHRWAVFCAASVEYLCQKYTIPCPDWVHHSMYTLPEPWFRGIGAHKPHVQERLKQEAPEPFARRNIYCSATIFANKYETATKVLQLAGLPQQ